MSRGSGPLGSGGRGSERSGGWAEGAGSGMGRGAGGIGGRGGRRAAATAQHQHHRTHRPLCRWVIRSLQARAWHVKMDIAVAHQHHRLLVTSWVCLSHYAGRRRSKRQRSEMAQRHHVLLLQRCALCRYGSVHFAPPPPRVPALWHSPRPPVCNSCTMQEEGPQRQGEWLRGTLRASNA